MEQLLDYNNPEINARQSIAPNASCDIDGEYADVRNLMHLARTQAARIIALEAKLAEKVKVKPLDNATQQKLREALRFAASRSVLSSEDERRILSALEATPHAPKVTEATVEQAKREAIDALISADQVWTDYGSGFRVHFSFPANSDKMWVVERINTARAALTAAQESGQ